MSYFSLAVFETDWVILNFNWLCSEIMNGQTTFQMLKQNFEVLVETEIEQRKQYTICIKSVLSLYSCDESSLQHATGWKNEMFTFLLPVEFLCSSHSFLSAPLVALSLSLSLKRVNALPTHRAADVMLFPGIGHQQGNVNAERQIRCTLTSVQSHAVIIGSSFCESKTTRLIISYNTLQSPRRQIESDTCKEMLLCMFFSIVHELFEMILLVSVTRDQKCVTM